MPQRRYKFFALYLAVTTPRGEERQVRVGQSVEKLCDRFPLRRLSACGLRLTEASTIASAVEGNSREGATSTPGLWGLPGNRNLPGLVFIVGNAKTLVTKSILISTQLKRAILFSLGTFWR